MAETAESTDTPIDGQTEYPDGDPRELASPANTLQLVDQPMIDVNRLKPDPDNPRDDFDLNAAFCASIAESGVEVPLVVRTDPDDPAMCVIVEGERRWRAARQVGLTEVPYRLKATADEADRYLTMYVTNHPDHRQNHTPYEQLAAISLAHASGASKTKIRKRTGLSSDDVTQAIRAGKLAPDTVRAANGIDEDWTIADYAVLADFDDDPEAIDQLLAAKQYGHPIEHQAALIRQEKADAAEHRRLVDQFTLAGIQVTENLPIGALTLEHLRSGSTGPAGANETTDTDNPDIDGASVMSPEEHADCPHQGVYFPQSLAEPVHYCTDPIGSGHQLDDSHKSQQVRARKELLDAGVTVVSNLPSWDNQLHNLEHDGEALTEETHHSCPGHVAYLTYGKPSFYCADPDRHGHTHRAASRGHTAPVAGTPAAHPRDTVIKGNLAWKAAAQPRRDFLAQLAQRKTLQKKAQAFLTTQLLARPTPVRASFSNAGTDALFEKLTGKSYRTAADEAKNATSGRQLIILMMAVAAAYEKDIVDEDGARRATWRTDGQQNPYCTRSEAAAYLKILVDLGYKPSNIEKAVIAGVDFIPGVDPDSATVDEDEDEDGDATDLAAEAPGEQPQTGSADLAAAEPSDASYDDNTSSDGAATDDGPAEVRDESQDSHLADGDTDAPVVA